MKYIVHKPDDLIEGYRNTLTSVKSRLTDYAIIGTQATLLEMKNNNTSQFTRIIGFLNSIAEQTTENSAQSRIFLSNCSIELKLTINM